MAGRDGLRFHADRVAAFRGLPIRWAGLDVALYGGAAAFAARSATSSPLVDYRTWAACAWPAYALGAAGALLLCLGGRGLAPSRLTYARATLAAVVLTGALVLPLAREVNWRLVRGSEYVASEAIVTEEAAAELLHGRNPYAARFGSPDLSWRAPSIADHFPYLPAMALAGLPHALAPRHAWSDARVLFALMTGVAAALALLRWRAPPDRRLTALQVLVLLPTGAPLLTTGGDDVPVLALSLLALVLLDAGRPGRAAMAAGAASALKLTGWPVLLAVLVVSWPSSGRRSRVRAALPLVGPLALTFAAVVVGPGSFADDVILFPLGLTESPTPADSQTLGRLLLSPLGDMPRDSAIRFGLTAFLLALAVLASARLLLRVRASKLARPGPAAALAAAGVSLVLIALAPVGRVGYLIYPIDLVIWSVLLRGSAIGERSGRPALPLLMDDRVELQPAG